MHRTTEIAIWVVKNQTSGQETFLKYKNSFECPIPFILGTRRGNSIFQGRLPQRHWLGAYGKTGNAEVWVSTPNDQVGSGDLASVLHSPDLQHSLWTQSPLQQSFAEDNISIKWCMWQSFTSPKCSRWLPREALKGWREVMLLGGGGSAGQTGAFSLFLCKVTRLVPQYQKCCRAP